MARRFTGGRLVIASHNPGKVREIAELLAPFGAEVVSAAELGLDEPAETGRTFAENAVIKAEAAARAARLPALADDSGLVVPALGGAPGVRSARWAGPDKDFRRAMRRIEDGLSEADSADEDPRRAHFVCALALAWPPDALDGRPHVETFEGTVHGRLVWPPRGDRGFGYDPMFVPRGGERTFAEMDPAEKHRISHRADAFARLVDACFRS